MRFLRSFIFAVGVLFSLQANADAFGDLLKDVVKEVAKGGRKQNAGQDGRSEGGQNNSNSPTSSQAQSAPTNLMQWDSGRGDALYLESYIEKKEITREQWHRLAYSGFPRASVMNDRQHIMSSNYRQENNAFKKEKMLDEFIRDIGEPRRKQVIAHIEKGGIFWARVWRSSYTLYGYDMKEKGFPIIWNPIDAVYNGNDYALSKYPVRLEGFQTPFRPILEFSNPEVVEEMYHGGNSYVDVYFKAPSQFSSVVEGRGDASKRMTKGIALTTLMVKVSITKNGSLAFTGFFPKGRTIPEEIVQYCARCNDNTDAD